MHILKKALPLIISLTLFITISYVVQTRLVAIEGLLQETTSWQIAMMLYVLVGIASVVVPFTSLIPVVPVAVALWGWPLTSALTLVSWMIGGQVLFELSRALGKPAIEKLVGTEQLESIGKVLQGEKLLRSILLRIVIQSDMVSIAFALFTRMGRGEFLLVTALGAAPWAVTYSLFGVLPLLYQILGAIVVCVGVILYWMFMGHRGPVIPGVAE